MLRTFFLGLVLPLLCFGNVAPNSIKVGSVVRAALASSELEAPQRAHFMLKLRNFEELKSRIERGEVVSLQELQDRYFPTQETWARVAAWAGANGYSVQPEERTHMTVFASATVAQVQSTLGLRYSRLMGSDGREYTSTTDTPAIPRELVDCVAGIAETSSHLRPRPTQQITPVIFSDGSPFLTPQGVRHLYNADASGMDGTGVYDVP